MKSNKLNVFISGHLGFQLPDSADDLLSLRRPLISDRVRHTFHSLFKRGDIYVVYMVHDARQDHRPSFYHRLIAASLRLEM